MKELVNKPGFLPTHGTFGADLSFLMAIAFTVLFIIGWRMAKKRKSDSHHVLVLWAMVSMIVYFTVYYLARGLGALATEGKEGFGGPEWVYQYVFSPLLTIHILVVSTGLILAGYMIILGFRVTIKTAGKRMLQAGILKMSPTAFRNAAIATFALFAVLAIIRWGSLGRFLVYFFGFLLIMGVLMLEKGIERLIPDGEKRHRWIGTFTMVLYVIALATSSITYVMLYVIWPPKIIV